MIKDADPSVTRPPARSPAVARYRHANRIEELLTEKWGRMRAARTGPPPTFDQIESVLLADETLRMKDGEPMRWGLP